MKKATGTDIKLIFLDVDGVLNSHESMKLDYEKYGTHLARICPILTERFLQLIQDTGAEIVLSSTWRLDAISRGQVRDAGIRFISTTPFIPQSDRHFEIRVWLSDLGLKLGVSDYVILDDDSDAEIAGHFYKTDAEFGLTEEICDQIRTRFNGTNTINAGTTS